jgi:hypothetical protein
MSTRFFVVSFEKFACPDSIIFLQVKAMTSSRQELQKLEDPGNMQFASAES